MALATVDAAGMPNVRMTLLKGVDPAGRGGARLRVLHQLRERQGPGATGLEGGGALLPLEVAAPAGARARTRLGGERGRGRRLLRQRARAAAGSAPGPRSSRGRLESRFALEKAVAAVTARYPIGEVPRPPYWSGFRVTPIEMEFWHDRPFRLHERVAFRRGNPNEPWHKQRLYPSRFAAPSFHWASQPAVESRLTRAL